MFEYAKENPFLFAFLVAIMVWAIERIIRSYIERNKPMPSCCQEEDDGED